MSDWITTEQAVALSGYTPEHVRRLIKTGEIKAQKWGREWQVSRRSVLAYLQRVQQLGRRRGPKPGGR